LTFEYLLNSLKQNKKPILTFKYEYFLLFTSAVPRIAPFVHQHTFKWSTASLAPAAVPCSALPLNFRSDVSSEQ